MDVLQQNRIAWVYTKTVTKEIIEKRKKGDWEIFITAGKPVPRSWFPNSIRELKIFMFSIR